MFHSRFSAVFVSVLAIGLITRPAHSQCDLDETAVVGPSAFPIQSLGRSVAIDGDWLFSGGESSQLSNAVAVFRYIAGTWTPVTHFVPIGNTSDYLGFGIRLSISGETALVSAHHAAVDGNSRAGAAFVFRWNGTSWSTIATLKANDPQERQSFGGALSLDGSTAVIGADGDDDNGSYSGAVYVFRELNGSWSQIAKLHPVDPEPFDHFGFGVAIDSDTLVVGANLEDEGGYQSGAAYVFRESGGAWHQVAKLIADDAYSGDYFGVSVSIDGDTILVGAIWDDEGATNSGSCYVFRETEGHWSQIAKLTAHDPQHHDQFGFSVALDNGTALIGSARNLESSTPGGISYVFQETNSGWIELSTLGTSDGATDNDFGRWVALSGTRAVVGASTADLPGSGSGAAYVYELRFSTDDCNLNGRPDECDADCNQNGIPDDCDLDLGTSPDCNGNLIPDECDISAGTSLDCNGNDVPDECDIASGASDDCDSNGVPDDCQLDCNANHTPDVCDLANATSVDCNRNGIPDECDLATEASPDCNANSIPDECDVELETSSDCDHNGVPDECDEDCNGNGIPDACDVVPTHLARLFASDGAQGDRFGNAVDLCNDTLIVGSEFADNGGISRGAAYLFRNGESGWAHIATLTASDAEDHDEFGNDVAIDGDTVIVGAMRERDGGYESGAAYVFREIAGSWQQIAKLVANDAAPYDQFGFSVDISGTTAVVGMFEAPNGEAHGGGAYIFQEMDGTWQQVAKLTDEEAASDDYFGYSVAVDGSRIMIGSIVKGPPDNRKGAVFAYRNANGVWLPDGVISREDGAMYDEFGCDVRIDGDRAVIGAFQTDIEGVINAGAAYEYRRAPDGWLLSRTFVADPPVSGGYFGYRVALSGRTAAFGSNRSSNMPNSPGAAYIFREIGGDWTLTATLSGQPSFLSDYFGLIVGLDGRTAVVSAMNEDAVASRSGAVHLFSVVPASTDCNANLVPDDCEPPLGTIADFVAALLSASADPFDICILDGDDSGSLDGQDVAPFVTRLLTP